MAARLARLALALGMACFPTSGPAAMDFSAFLPPKAAQEAAALARKVDAAASGIAARRAAAREAQLAAERDCVLAWALAEAGRSGGAWASPDGALLSSEAPAAFAAARSRATAAADALAADLASAEGVAVSLLAARRDKAAAELAVLLAGAGLGEKAAAAAARGLSDPAPRSPVIFPEFIEAGRLLAGSGATGRSIWLSALCPRDQAACAARLLSVRERAVKSTPAAGAALDRLASAFTAYAALSRGFVSLAYPAGSAARGGALSAAAAVESLAALPPERAAALIAAMEAGDGREAAAAAGARRLASLVETLGPIRRRSLSLAAGIPEEALVRLSAAALPAVQGTAPAAAAGTPFELGAALAKADAALAFLPAAGGTTPRPDPVLILLERPGLMATAARDDLWADFHTEALRRLSGLYARADARAAELLAADKALVKAAARALGATPASIAIEAGGIGGEDGGRQLFYLVRCSATGRQGELLMPVPAERAVSAYAAAFSAMAGLEGNGTVPASTAAQAALLSRYGQRVLSALAPGEGRAPLVLGAMPTGAGANSLDQVQVEAALLEGWAP